jgi:DNA primase
VSVTDDIKARIDIVDLIQSYNVSLKRAGHTYKACCPFHNEKTPSFSVNPDRQSWYCFGACAEGGDIFNFVMKQENVDFKEALQLLAARAGIELKPLSNEQKQRDIYLEKLTGLLNATTEFFHLQLLEAPEAEFARQYVAKRGLSAETVARFRIGFAPKDWRAALTHLQEVGYSEQEILDVGVALRNEKGNVYDRFRNRLVIPIRNPKGEVIGFGARALDPNDNPKYLNSPQTALFDKSKTLFAFDAARRAIRETETAVIVEGYMDALQAHQAGFSNVIAQMGTALTEVQLQQLAKVAKKIVIALDPDAAGVSATLRSLNVAQETLGEKTVVFDSRGVLRQSRRLDMDIRVMSLPEGQDPDDLIRDEPELWQGLVEKAQTVLDYVIESAAARITPQMTQADRESIARQILPVLLEDPLHRHYSVTKLAARLRIDERYLIGVSESQLALNQPVPATQKQQEKHAQKVSAQVAQAAQSAGSLKIEQAIPAAPLAPAIPKTNGIDIEGYCLALLIANPSYWALINRKLSELAREPDPLLTAFGAQDFERTDYRAIISIFEQALEQVEAEPMDYLYENLPGELSAEIDRLLPGPLSTIQVQWSKSELASINKEKRFVKPTPEELEFIAKALELRARRIERENREIRFMVQQDEQEQGNTYGAQVFRRVGIIKRLEAEIRNIRQTSR